LNLTYLLPQGFESAPELARGHRLLRLGGWSLSELLELGGVVTLTTDELCDEEADASMFNGSGFFELWSDLFCDCKIKKTSYTVMEC